MLIGYQELVYAVEVLRHSLNNLIYYNITKEGYLMNWLASKNKINIL